MSTAGPQYPTREPFFAMKALRLLAKSGDVQRIGADAFALVTVVASMEDVKRYRGPVNFWNSQLQSTLGFAKWERLDNARRRAVDAGWLHYIAPESGSRAPGYYWTLIPAVAADLPDTSCDESPDPLASFYHRGYADGVAGRPAKAYPDNGYGQGGDTAEAYPLKGDARNLSSPDQGYGQGDARGYASGDARGEHPILSLSLNTSPAQERPDAKPGPAGKTRKQRTTNYSPEDLQAARTFWERILALQPDRKPPKLDAWANTIRLMREQDHRDHATILDLLERVQRDSFWWKQILSPEKLREKFDDLSLKLRPLSRQRFDAEPLPELRGVGA